MDMHDFRRAAATSLAIEAPDKIGLVSGLLQHAKQDTTGRHYNLAGEVLLLARGFERHSAIDAAPVSIEELLGKHFQRSVMFFCLHAILPFLFGKLAGAFPVP